MKMDHKDVKTSNYEIGLTKIIGSKVKEIHGYLTTEFDEPTFKLCRIEFEDGSELCCEGVHDLPYLTGCGQKTPKNYDDETLESILKSDPDYEGEEE